MTSPLVGTSKSRGKMCGLGHESCRHTPRSAACGFPPPRPLTLEDLAKASTRSRRGDDASNPHHKYNYDKHRERVMSAKPFVDTTNPLVVRNTYSSPASFNRSITNFVRIERENARMLHRIATIMKSAPTVDNRLHEKNKSINVRRSKAREMNLLQIAFDNLEMWKRIQNVAPAYGRKKQLLDYAKAEKVMQQLSYYPLFWKITFSSTHENMKARAMANAQGNPRPAVFLTLETDEEALGQVVIELRADVVPMTAENFRCLCTGELGMSYKCSEMHRIIPGVLWQGGEVIGKDGRGGKSIYGDTFPDENFRLKHREAGVVSMANCGKDSNGSQFLITANCTAALDGVNVVVGKVIKGMEVLEKLNSFVGQSGMMKKNIWISNCGEGAGDENEDAEEQAPTDFDQTPPTTGAYEADPDTE